MKELIIGTWNVSECVSTVWDVREGISRDQTQYSVFDCVTDIARKINESHADVVCLQEYPVTQHGRDDITRYLTDHTQLVHYYGVDTYPSFLLPDASVGIAIFSRYPLENIEYHPFENPNIQKLSRSGKIYYSFDKGLITARLKVDSADFAVVTGHAVSFSPFDARAEDYPRSFDALRERIETLCAENPNVIAIGDFNTEALFDILPTIQNHVRDVMDGPTTVSGLMEGEIFEEGRKLDYCLVTPSIRLVKDEKILNFSDHLFCICHLRIKDDADL